MRPISEGRNPTPPAFKTLSTVWLALLFQMSHVIRDDARAPRNPVRGLCTDHASLCISIEVNGKVSPARQVFSTSDSIAVSHHRMR